jgi:RNA polymerase sigma factor (TIGR02999 family)
MSDVTQIVAHLNADDPQAAEQLLPLIYDELRRLAERKMAAEKAGHTLNATALVHEAYLRLIGNAAPQPWQGRAHFYAAAAEAMRRILVENARRKRRIKHGGQMPRVELVDVPQVAQVPDDDLLAIDEVLDALTAVDSQAAQVVKLHFFAGLAMDDVAQTLGISVRTAHRDWSFARAWLFDRLERERP